MNIQPVKQPLLPAISRLLQPGKDSATAITVPLGPNRHAVRAAEYRAIAAQALSSAETSGLAHVREKFTRSAQVWTEMAEAHERRAHSAEAAR